MAQQMTKVEVIAGIAGRTGKPKAEVEAFMDAFSAVATSALKDGREVPVFGLGKLKTGQTGERKQKTPKGVDVTIPARTVVKFVASKAAKASVNKAE